MWKLILLLAMAGTVALVAGAVKLFGWWAVVIVPLVGLVLAKLVLGRLVKRLFMMPFKAKGAVLRGARAQVHAVNPTMAPRADDEGAEQLDDVGSRDFYEIEATITPAAAPQGPFQLWEPGEIRLVPPGFKPEDDSADDACEIVKLEIQGDGGWHVEEGMKYPGPQRLRLTAAVKRGLRQLRFQYYFELFGTVSLPAILGAKAVAAGPHR
jgi:hypothetical protein